MFKNKNCAYEGPFQGFYFTLGDSRMQKSKIRGKKRFQFQMYDWNDNRNEGEYSRKISFVVLNLW